MVEVLASAASSIVVSPFAIDARRDDASSSVAEVTEQVISEMTKTRNNKEFVKKMDSYLRRFK